MEARKLLDALIVAGKLKDTTRHCYTAKGRHESVAEHSYLKYKKNHPLIQNLY